MVIHRIFNEFRGLKNGSIDIVLQYATFGFLGLKKMFIKSMA